MQRGGVTIVIRLRVMTHSLTVSILFDFISVLPGMSVPAWPSVEECQFSNRFSGISQHHHVGWLLFLLFDKVALADE